ncbi:MAG: biotin--[Lachnospiraceae bacterium]|nr:biotin--[acetyl-CoA-carboxylase] ligase [Lachnospiraceae bacterium]
MKKDDLNKNQYNENKLKEMLCTNWLGKEIKFFDICDSTNIRLQELAKDGAKEGTVVISKEQTAGQGRNGRVWNSPKGEGIFLSMLLRPNFHPSYASMITLVTALAVFSALEKNGVEHLSIKWPNDIVANGKKLCGILTKMSTAQDAIHYVIVGLGINVNQTRFDSALEQVATSIYLETKEEKSQLKIIADLLSAFETYYETFLTTQDLSLLKEEYNQKLVHLNSMVRIVENGQEKTVKALGINETGELLIEEQGQIKTILAGEISVRGIYGYT